MVEYTVQEQYSRSYVKDMGTNNYEVIITDNAKEELEKIYEYIADNLIATSSANNLMEQIEQKVLRLEQFPYSCPEVKVKPRNLIYRKLIVNKNYIALYRIDEKYKQVNIIHIYYAKRDYLM